MFERFPRTIATGLIVAVGGLGLAGCGGKTTQPSQAEKAKVEKQDAEKRHEQAEHPALGHVQEHKDGSLTYTIQAEDGSTYHTYVKLYCEDHDEITFALDDASADVSFSARPNSKHCDDGMITTEDINPDFTSK